MMKEVVAASVVSVLVGGIAGYFVANQQAGALRDALRRTQTFDEDTRPASSWIRLTAPKDGEALCQAQLLATDGMRQRHNAHMSWRVLESGCSLPDGTVFLDFDGQGNPVHDGKSHPFTDSGDLEHRQWIVAKTKKKSDIPDGTDYKYKIKFRAADGKVSTLIDPELEIVDPPIFVVE